MHEHADDLATLMTLEQGKPISEARAEIAYAAGFLEWFSEEASRSYGEVIPSHLRNRRLQVTLEPVGVTAAITPWNFPAAMITRKAGAALAAGCPMIVRPARETPFSALALAHLAERAGVPEGVLSVVTGDARPILDVLAGEPEVRAISFTGSTEVGRIVLEQCAPLIKRASLELGGHAPFIVFDDYDIERAVRLCMQAKFTTSGQDCLAANRIYVHEAIYEPFVDEFSAAVSRLTVGNGLHPNVDIGPLITDRAVAKVEAHVINAVDEGARVTAGGGRHSLGGRYFEPTVLSDVSDSMRVAREETFGPVAPILRFRDEEEVVARANDAEFGLAAYVLTESLARAERLIPALEYGMVAVNTAAFTGSPIPFGGVKQSGLGREGGRQGMAEFMQLKYACVAGADD
jgi:succinate-semialdehyde dehydrogenase